MIKALNSTGPNTVQTDVAAYFTLKNTGNNVRMQIDNALYIVATPIGNLGDITQRALDILQQADLIAAEDTRHSGRLLQHFNISTRMISYHDHSDERQVESIIAKLQAGSSIALISDAGTPLISDPGYGLVKIAREAGVKVVPVPGVSAVITAMSAAGLPSDRFSFEGFPPHKTGARQQLFSNLARDTRTLVFYESPHRIADSLKDLCVGFGEDREIVMARELTKTFETFLTGSAAQVLDQVLADSNQQKGEIVIMVSGYRKPDTGEQLAPEAEATMKVLLEELPVKQAAAIGAKLTGEKKNKLYQWALAQN